MRAVLLYVPALRWPQKAGTLAKGGIRLDELLAQCGKNAMNVEFLYGMDATGDVLFGFRLRPFGRRYPKNKMVLGSGFTAESALREAVEKAKAGRWESIDWAARPWETHTNAEDALWIG